MGQSESTENTSIKRVPDILPLEHNIPEEVLIHILSYVDAKTLVNFRLVCRLWKHFIDNEVWKLKLSRRKYRSLKGIDPRRKLPWYVYERIYVSDPFQKNLLTNHCGQDQLEHWNILSSGGNHWAIEDPPQGSDSLPQSEDFEGLTSCFVTSYHSCTKEQVINLLSVGMTSKVMDELQPYIEVSDWYAGRFDCGCVYELHAELLDAEKKPVVDHDVREGVVQWQGREWHKVSYIFQNYGPGVRYIKFCHGGMDTQFWAGHYGSKMTGACIKLTIPPTSSRRPSCREGDSETEENSNCGFD